MPLTKDSHTPLLLRTALQEFTILDFDLFPFPAFDEMPYAYIQVIVGAQGYIEFGFRQVSEVQFAFSTLARYKSPIPCDYSHVVIVNPDCILALTAVHDINSNNANWVLTNLVTHQTVSLPHLEQDYRFFRTHRNLLTPDGRSVVYLRDNHIYIQLINPEGLIPAHFPQHPYLEWLRSHEDYSRKEKSDNASFIASLDFEEFFTKEREKKVVDAALIADLPKDAVQLAVHRWMSTRPTKEGGFGLSTLPPDEDYFLSACAVKITHRTGKALCVVDAAGMDDKITVRQLVSLIVGHELANGEFTMDVTRQLEKARANSLVIIDHAENLSLQAFQWICQHLRSVTEVFILVVRDVNKLKERCLG